MSRTLRRAFLSFRGRLSLSAYWMGASSAIAAFAVFFVFLENVAGRGSTLVLYPPLVWSLAALTVKRLHDRGVSAWSLLAGLIPILGPVWLFVVLALKAGTPGENQYGEDPRTFDTDYLTVQ